MGKNAYPRTRKSRKKCLCGNPIPEGRKTWCDDACAARRADTKSKRKLLTASESKKRAQSTDLIGNPARPNTDEERRKAELWVLSRVGKLSDNFPFIERGLDDYKR